MQFVQYQRKHDDERKADGDIVDVDENRIGDDRVKVFLLKQHGEVVQADPWTRQDADPHVQILERYQHAVHGHVAEHDHEYDARKHEHVDEPVTADVLDDVVATAGEPLPRIGDDHRRVEPCVIGAHADRRRPSLSRTGLEGSLRAGANGSTSSTDG